MYIEVRNSGERGTPEPFSVLHAFLSYRRCASTILHFVLQNHVSSRGHDAARPLSPELLDLKEGVRVLHLRAVEAGQVDLAIDGDARIGCERDHVAQ